MDDDVYDYDYALANGLKLLESQVPEKDRALIKRLIEHLKAQGVSTGRLAKYIFHLKTIRLNLGCDFEDAKREDIEKLMVYLRSKGYSAWTLADYIMVLKRFFKFVRSGNVDKDTPFPEEVRWLKKTMKANEVKKPEFLTPAEVEAMISGGADSLRDKAMISVGFEAGLRASELLSLNVGSVAFDGMGAKIRINGKTGERIVRLISSASLLSRYLETYRFRDRPEMPLWASEARNHFDSRIEWESWNRRLKQIAGKAGVTGKRIHNHLLRHGSATEAAKYLSDSELKIRFGWTMGSKMPAVYVHLSGADLDGKLQALYSGRKTEPQKPEFFPVTCPRCSERNSPGIKYCGRCGTPLDQKELTKSSVEIEEMKVEMAEIRKMLEIALSQPSQAQRGSVPLPTA